MASRGVLSWDLMEGRTGWGIVATFLLVGVLGITATVERWINPHLGVLFLIAFSLFGSILSVLYTRYSVRAAEKENSASHDRNADE